MGNKFHKQGAGTEKAMFPHNRNVFGSVNK